MIPMFPFSINNALKLFTIEPFDEDAIKDRISQAVIQSLPNKRNIKFNAIVVLECDNEPRRTLVINETIGGPVTNGGTLNVSKMQVSFPQSHCATSTSSFSNISSSDMTSTSNVLLSQQPLFPATLEGLQALLNLNRSDGVVHNNISFIPLQTESLATNFKTESLATSFKTEKLSGTHTTEMGAPSRKRKSEKPCKIPQESGGPESQGLDLTLGGRYEEKCVPATSTVSIWPGPGTNLQPGNVQRPKKPPQAPGHKKTSKVFNCNQCKLQFSSLNALCKHTFSDHRAFRCTFCSANFTQRSNLQRHSLKHVGFKPFICNVCGKAYYRKDHLVRHIEVSHPGSDPKSNITVKLSSSECLEYLEKMQNNRILELDAVKEGQNHFLTTAETDARQDEDATLFTIKSSPLSGDMAPVDDFSPKSLPPYDYTRETSLTDSESPEKLQICFDEVVKEEERDTDMSECASVVPEVPVTKSFHFRMTEEVSKHYPLIQPKKSMSGFPSNGSELCFQGYPGVTSSASTPGPIQGYRAIQSNECHLQGYPPPATL